MLLGIYQSEGIYQKVHDQRRYDIRESKEVF